MAARVDLDASPSDLKSFLDTMRDGVVVVGADKRVLSFNQSYVAQFGLEPGDIAIGDHMRDLYRRLAEKGKLGERGDRSIDEIVAERVANFRRQEGRVERRFMDSGRVLDIYRTFTTNDETVSVHVDVTETVRTEREVERQRLYMKNLLENTTDGITLLDRHGRFVMFNRRFLGLYDIDPEAVRWGISYAEFSRHFGDLAGLPPEDREREVQARRQFAFDPSITHVRRRLANGRTLNINKTNLPDGGCVMTMRDMTEELMRENELLKARNVAEESSRHKSEFVARMSHEMRTPLNGILGVAALLERAGLDDKQQELVGVITASGKVLLRLIDDILDLSRLDAASFEVVADDLDVLGLLTHCMEIVRPSAEEKDLIVGLRTPDRVPLLRGDMVRIKQIVLNLLTNAVKFTEKGRIDIVLETETVDDGVALALSVADSGVGIAPEKLDQIFDSFYQIDGTLTRKYGGAGLGLAITRRLVGAMGGTIHVSSRPGDGTIFRIRLTLPIAEAAPRPQ